MTGPTRAPATLAAAFRRARYEWVGGSDQQFDDMLADAALDWVAEQLADPEVIEVVARAINALDNAVLADTNFERLGGTYAEQSGVALTAALAALRDRAAPVPDTAHAGQKEASDG